MAAGARRTPPLPPPPPPPSSPVPGTWHRPEPSRSAAAFTIDAILGRCRRAQHHDPGSHLPPSKALVDSRRGDRLMRSAPYTTLRGEESGGHCVGGLHPPANEISCDPSTCGGGGGGGGGGGMGCGGRGGGGAGGKSKCKRVRTIFTADQLERLEAEFARQQYMVGPERLYLAAALNLTEAQVKVWFQNRRIKWRKQYIEHHHQQQAKVGSAAFQHDDPPSGAQMTVDSDDGDSGSNTEDESAGFEEESYSLAEESVSSSIVDRVPPSAFLSPPVSATPNAAVIGTGTAANGTGNTVNNFDALIPPAPWSAGVRSSAAHLFHLDTGRQGEPHSPPRVLPEGLPLGFPRSLLSGQGEEKEEKEEEEEEVGITGRADQSQQESRTLGVPGSVASSPTSAAPPLRT
ncbi:uncharacterized protein LOC143041571 [Oratosquilla oratoria]|uniref:uncharacterized protein LOC143041571 n=1 Tax=Oratosquilla oratoria TaxID=337810 RepID=UPI003F75E5B5